MERGEPILHFDKIIPEPDVLAKLGEILNTPIDNETLTLDCDESTRMSLYNSDKHNRCVEYLRSLLDIPKNEAQSTDEDEDPLTDKQYYFINSHITRLLGLGENFFILDEDNPEDILETKTLYDFLLTDHRLRERLEEQHNPEFYCPKPFEFFFDFWARYIDDSQLQYATLSSISSYAYYTLEEVLGEQLDKLIPISVELKEVDSDNVNDSRRHTEMVLSPPHLKAPYIELRLKGSEWILNKAKQLVTNESDKLYVIRRHQTPENTDEPNYQYIFSSEAVSKNIEFRTFVKSLSPYLTADSSSLDEFIEEQREALCKFIEFSFSKLSIPKADGEDK